MLRFSIILASVTFLIWTCKLIYTNNVQKLTNAGLIKSQSHDEASFNFLKGKLHNIYLATGQSFLQVRAIIKL